MNILYLDLSRKRTLQQPSPLPKLFTNSLHPVYPRYFSYFIGVLFFSWQSNDRSTWRESGRIITAGGKLQHKKLQEFTTRDRNFPVLFIKYIKGILFRYNVITRCPCLGWMARPTGVTKSDGRWIANGMSWPDNGDGQTNRSCQHGPPDNTEDLYQ